MELTGPEVVNVQQDGPGVYTATTNVNVETLSPGAPEVLIIYDETTGSMLGFTTVGHTASVDRSGNVVFTDSGNNVASAIAAKTGRFYGQAMTAGSLPATWPFPPPAACSSPTAPTTGCEQYHPEPDLYLARA